MPGISALEHAPRSGSAGFTLLELMVVVAVSAIILMIAVPEFNQFIADQRVRTAISSVYGDLVLARADALNNQRRVIVQGGNGADWTAGWTVCVAATATSYDCSGADIEARIIRQGDPLGGRLKTCGSPASLQTGRIAFRPDGRIETEVPFGGTDYIRISDNMADTVPSNDKIRSIYFGPTGRMSTAVENGTSSGVAACP